MDLSKFSNSRFYNALENFFEQLQVPISKIDEEVTTPENIIPDNYKKNNEAHLLINSVYFLGMVNKHAFDETLNTQTLNDVKQSKKDYEGILIFGIELNERQNNLLPTRSQLAEISRAFNREFNYTPVTIVFKYNKKIAFANSERLQYKQEWREGEKVGKISLLRDIDIEKPHSGHIRILDELKIPKTGKNAIDSFEKLYKYWQEVFSVNLLNKKFYKELSNWYFWAIKYVRFPNRPTEEDAHKKGVSIEEMIREHNATNVIRLLTRILFVWFIKEKKLIPEELFDFNTLQDDILKNIAPYQDSNGLFSDASRESIYYKAILQNLFFATLNCPVVPDDFDKRSRQFRVNNHYGQDRGNDWMYRYEKYFKNPQHFIKLMNDTVPFLNGGLFECLDIKQEQNLYIDGFSDQMTKGQHLVVPDFLFFSNDICDDISEISGINDNQNKQADVKGLIKILKSYKFTLTENTPVEEDVELDPELLGKVFENLLASYNPETKTTARKQTGSFYTPREIVNYMVDESLIAYLKNRLSNVNVARGIPASANNPKNLPTSANSPNDKPPFLDPLSDIYIHEGDLPHWKQENVFYFVTFRLEDSIPRDKLEELLKDRENWKKRYANKSKKEYTKQDWIRYNRLFSERVEKWMNAGYGKCLLKKQENAKIVADALNCFANERYELDEWVIMPNHVHILVRPYKNYHLSDILHSWKSFTSNEINKREGRKGTLWMRESYDHIVRNEDALKAIRNYIRLNPEKAGIKVHYQSYNVPQGIPASPNVARGILASANANVAEGIPASAKANLPKNTPTPNNDNSSDNKNQSKDALETLLDKDLHLLLNYSDINPFSQNQDTTWKLITALDECKILDPACGSGAFPMGVLQKMVHILQKLDPSNELWEELQLQKAMDDTKTAYQIEDKKQREQRIIEINEAFDKSINDPDYARKLYLIENCIYGVDIQPIAIQISKLRFFISLVVDQKPNKESDNFGIKALPNLETRFVAANTLIGIDKPDAQMSLFETDELVKAKNELKRIRHKLFGARTKETKQKYREKDEELRNKIAELLKQNNWPSETAEKLASWDPYDQNASSPFFEPEWMFDIKDGFDVVIGNPPYVITKKDKYKGFDWYGDLYTLFWELSIKRFMKIKAVLSFITPKFFLFNQVNHKMRVDILTKLNVLKIVECTPFDAVTENAITILTNEPPAHETIDYFTFFNSKFKMIRKYNKCWAHLNLFCEINPYVNEDIIKIISKIDSNCIKLKEIVNSKRGAEIGKKDLLNNNIGKPILIGFDVNQYLITPTQAKIRENHKEYLRLKEFFSNNYLILLRRVAPRLIASISVKPIAFSKNLYGLKAKGETYSFFILALLNSIVMNFYYKNKFSMKKEEVFPEIQAYLFEQLPIKKANTHIIKLIASKSRELVNVMQGNDAPSIIINKIDELVFKLYDLTYDEVLVVCPEFWLSREEYDDLKSK